MKQSSKRGLLSDPSGATAVEFAMVAPVFFALVLGIIHLSFLALTVGSLNYSVEKGARCAALSTAANCPADSYYFAPGNAPVFTYSGADCGTSLTGEVTYSLSLVIYQASVPLRASACFP